MSPPSRKTNIQVCVRIRPILSSNNDDTSSAPTASPTISTQSKTNPRRNNNSGNSNNSSDDISPRKNARNSTRIPPFTPKSTSKLQPTSSINKIPRRRPQSWDDDTRSAPCTPQVNSKSSNPNKEQEYAWEAIPISPSEPNISTTLSQTPLAALSNPPNSHQTNYSFDSVYPHTTSTSTIYTRSVSPIVQSTMDGYHGSVFAYGQTSTGKTYTMHGTPDSPGVVPLAVREVFNYIRNCNENREYLLRVSYMEIYNETIHDLLSAGLSPVVNSKKRNTHSTPIKNDIRIFESKSEGVVIRGLKEEVVTSVEQVLELVKLGEMHRRTGSTGMNKESSRSHSIFRLLVESRARNPCDASSVLSHASSTSSLATSCGDLSVPVRVSSLSLVDLAGSECAKLTGTTGQRRKEGNFINKSLMTLGLVVWKLSESQQQNPVASSSSIGDDSTNTQQPASVHIPYRDSKLTRLLQPSLSGNAQICLICNVSPLLSHVEESINTLKFASRAKRIKQVASVTEVMDDKTLLKNYREEIDDLKRQLRDAKERQEPLVPKIGKHENEEDISEKNEEEDEDTQTLVKAIQNLEKLILKTTPVKSNNQDIDFSDDENTIPSYLETVFSNDIVEHNEDDAVFSQTVTTTKVSSPKANKEKIISSKHVQSCAMQDSAKNSPPSPARNTDENVNSKDLSEISGLPSSPSSSTRNSFATVNASAPLTPPTQPFERNNQDEDLVVELHRIQNLLSNVLQRKSTVRGKQAKVVHTSPIPNKSLLPSDDPLRMTNQARPYPKTPTINNGVRLFTAGDDNDNSSEKNGITEDFSSPLMTPPPPKTPLSTANTINKNKAFQTPRDVEVESLKKQLQDQELTSSLRQADSSFLQSQLVQKDELLKEVSKILDAIERRQVELESENAKLQNRYAKAVGMLTSRDTEVKVLKSKLEEKEKKDKNTRFSNNYLDVVNKSRNVENDDDDLFSNLI